MENKTEPSHGSDAVSMETRGVRWERDVFKGWLVKALTETQAIQWPPVDLATQAEMLRLLIRTTAWRMNRMGRKAIEHELSDKGLDV